MKYSPELDGLRAIAAGLAFAFHAKIPWLSGGFFGVDIFFVLSGYLITRLLSEEISSTGGINYKRFFIRRLRRLLPPLLLMLAAYLAIAPIAFASTPMAKHIQDALISALYMADYVKPLGIPIDFLNHTWSLGVEEKFYLLWPLAFLLISRLPHKHGVAVIVALFVADTAWRGLNVMWLESYWQVYNRFDTHFTGLALGAALGYANVRLGSVWAVPGFAILALAMWTNPHGADTTAVLGFTEVEVAAALIICARPAFLGMGVLPWLGKMSYGFYLWHYLFVRVCRTNNLDWPETALIAGGLGLSAAALSYYTLESWMRARPAPPVTACTPSP